MLTEHNCHTFKHRKDFLVPCDWLKHQTRVIVKCPRYEKEVQMTEKERIAELLKNLPQVNHAEAAVHGLDYVFNCAADYLIANGVTITPAVPGPSEDDHNIMELCFHNGERHMKEKVGKELTRIAEHMPCITLAQALAMLEGL